MKTIALDIGHNAPCADTGAVGIKSEDELTKAVGYKLAEILKNQGYKIVFTCPNSASKLNTSLNYRVNQANRSKADLFVSIHFNAFNGKAFGTEVFVYSYKSAAYKPAQAVVDHIAKLGFAKRGVKTGNFAVIRNTTMPAMLIECCFVDSQRDMKLFDVDKMAFAIASGLVGKEVSPAPKNDDVSLLATLKVKAQTWLKPSTEQSTDIEKSQLKLIDVGEYPIKLIADEEAHYQILLEGKEWYIYSGHCELVNKSC